jgi:peptide/nickel transport system substrate-binding protein
VDERDEPGPRLTRRDLLKRGGAAGVVLALPALIAACGGDEEPAAEPAPATTEAPPATTEAPPATTEAPPATTEAPAPSGEPTPGGNLRLALSDGGSSEVLDPQGFISATDQYRTLNIWDRLAEVEADNTISLRLAESIEPATEGDSTVWIVRLKSGVTFHNGKDLTADDVIWTFQRLLREEAPYFSAVDPFVDGSKLRKVDDLTVEFGLKQAYGDFRRFLSNRYTHILADGTDTFTTPEECVGTGPYSLQEWAVGERATLAKNASWWSTGQPYLDSIELLQIAPDAQLNALLAGQVDGIERFNTLAEAVQYENDPSVQLFTLPGANVQNLTMRLDSPPFDDANVRLAFRLAFDRQTLLDTLYLGKGSLGNDLHGKAFPSYNSELPQREYDPEQAKALLAEAGHPDGIEVELVTGLYPEQAQIYAQQAQAAGITVNLKTVPAEDIYNTDLYYLKAPFSETSWGADSFEFIAPQGYVSDSPYNETAWLRPEWDARFFEAVGVADDAERNAIFFELQEELYNEGGYLIGAFGDTVYGGAPNVRGVIEQVPGFVWNDARFEQIWLEAS